MCMRYQRVGVQRDYFSDLTWWLRMSCDCKSALSQATSLTPQTGGGGNSSRTHILMTPAGDQPESLRQRVTVLYLAGYSQATVAARVDRTRERVRQILNDEGIELRSRAEQAVLDRAAREEKGDRAFTAAVSGREIEIQECFWRLRTFDAVAAHLSLNAVHVRRLLEARWPDVGVFVDASAYAQRQFTDEALADALRRAAQWKGTSGPLTIGDYDQWEDEGTESDPRPSYVLIRARLGSWRVALQRAGLPANVGRRGEGEFTTEACARALASCWNDVGRAPSMGEYDQWAAKQKDRGRSVPGTARIRTRFRHRWREAQIAAYPLVYGITPPLNAYRPPDEVTDASVRPTETGRDYIPRDTSVAMQAPELLAVDPQKLERGNRSHFKMQADLADAALSAGNQPLSPTPHDPSFDIAWRRAGELVVVEVKSATPDNLERQLRLGLGQILYYAQILRERGELVSAVLLIELMPDSTWFKVAQRAGVRLLTRDSVAELFA